MRGLAQTGRRQRATLQLCIAAAITLVIHPLIAPTANAAPNRIIHKELSLYRTILVAKDRQRLCMQFSVRRDQRNQSCKDVKDPQRLVFDYAKLVFAGLLMQPQPRSILVVGLGGGSLPAAFRSLLPDALIDVVEIDASVVKVAEEFFDYQISEPGELFVQDARIFGKRAAKAKRSYDIILLDAFNGEYIPEHLMTREYLLETQKLLNPGGVLLANTFSISELYHHESATYASVFGAFYTVAIPSSANRVIVAIKGEWPSITTIARNQQHWQSALEPLGVDLARIQRLLDSTPDWNIEARVLTDQYVPANLLQR